jgi:hypothetical protein
MTSRGVNERKIIVPASVEQVWATLADPSALQWMVRDCAFSVAVPDTPAGVGARWCWFRLDFSGGLSGGVFETTLSEPLIGSPVSNEERPSAAGVMTSG